MQVVVLREGADAERRVAATPETVKKLTGLGAAVVVENGAGATASIADDAYGDAGATIVAGRQALLSGADLILCVQGPEVQALAGAKAGAALVGMLSPYAERARISGYAGAGVDAFAME